MPRVNERILVGWQDVVDNLDELSKKLKKRVVTKSLRAAASEVRDEAKRRVSVRTGALKRFIGVQTKKAKPGQTAAVIVNIKKGSLVEQVSVKISPRGTKIRRKLVKREKAATGFTKRALITPRRYAHLLEFGTEPHSLRRGISKKTIAGRLYNLMDQSRNRHPGARPRPFLAPAAEAGRQRALDKAAMVLRDGIQQEARGKK